MADSKFPVRTPAGSELPVMAPAGSELPVMSPAGSELPVVAPADSELPVMAPADSELPVMAPADSELPLMAPADSELPVIAPADSELPVMAPAHLELPVMSSDVLVTSDISSAYRRRLLFKTIVPSVLELPSECGLSTSRLPSWEADINNRSDAASITLADASAPINIPDALAPINIPDALAPINIPDALAPINIPDALAPINTADAAAAINVTSVSTERSEERGTGGLDPYAPNHSLSDVKSLYDACKSGDTEKIFKLHAKCPELLSQNSNQYLLGIVESGNIDCYIAIESLLLKGKGEEERQQYIGSIRDTDNESVLHKACRSGSKDMYAYISTTYPNLVADKNYLLEIARSKSDLYDIIEKEYEINKK